jgi:NAD(P)-dependent dehydrogenase (short-subunit alcohol dehydrogenase family)
MRVCSNAFRLGRKVALVSGAARGPGSLIASVSASARAEVDLSLAPDYAAEEEKIGPLQRAGRCGGPLDVAGAAVYLASVLAERITGAQRPVGGRVAAA